MSTQYRMVNAMMKSVLFWIVAAPLIIIVIPTRFILAGIDGSVNNTCLLTRFEHWYSPTLNKFYTWAHSGTRFQANNN
jgi:hypothetical protein